MTEEKDVGSKYYGIYRAKVVEQNDERQRGRIKVQIPSITGEGKSQYCEACMNVAYDNGGDLAVPKMGDTVWVMFEEGDVNKPVYVGNFFGAFKTPLENYDENERIISWDKCRIAMKEGVMNVTVGEHLTIKVGGSTVIDITGDSIDVKTSSEINFHAAHIGFND